MKEQLIYVAGLLICMFLAYKVMKKVKDIPKEEEKEQIEELEKEDSSLRSE